MAKRPTSQPRSSGGTQGPSPAPPSPSGRSEPGPSGRQCLLTVTGSDHPGILDDISHYVGDRGASIEAVRVVNLRGRFALLMLIAGSETAVATVGADLHILMERTGVRVTLEAPHNPDGGVVSGTSFSLAASGGADADESTVLRQLSNLLKVLNINIRDVETRRTAPGGFEMTMEIDVSRDVPVGKLRELVGQLLNQHPLRWDLSATSAG